MYKNEKGEEISLDAYARAKYKALATKEGGSVFKSIMDDKDLTVEERQKVCLAIGKAGTLEECNKAKQNPATLMRSDSGVTQFNAAYLKHYGKTYMTAVADKSKEAIQNRGLSDLERQQAIVDGYTSEMGKLSKEAAEFIKVTSGVVKTAFPEQSDELTARVLVNNLSLRGTSATTSAWIGMQNVLANKTEIPGRTAPQTQAEIDRGETPKPFTLAMLREEVKRNIDKAGQQQLDTLASEIDTQKNAIKNLTEEVEQLEGQPFEQRVARQRIDQAKVALEKAQNERERVLKEKGPAIEKAKKEGEKALEPYADKLKPIEQGSLANNGALRKLNSTNGFGPEKVGEGELDINGYKETLGKMATGKVPGMELTEDIEVAEIDIDAVAVEVEDEAEKLDQARKLEAATKKVETDKTALETQKATYEQSLVKAKPEIDKIAALEKQLDSLNLAKRQLKNPEATMEVDKKKVEPYKPTAGDKFKAIFTKGGMDKVLENKREQMVDQIDKLKMTVQLKTDPDFYDQVTNQHKSHANSMTSDAGLLKQKAALYEAARTQVLNAEYTLMQDSNARGSDLPGLPKEEVEQAKLLKAEGEKAMEKYGADYQEHAYLTHQTAESSKLENVRASLKNDYTKQQKDLAQQQKQTEGTGKKVSDVVSVGEKVEKGQKVKVSVN